MEQWFRGILHKDWMKILTTGLNANRTVWWTAFDRMMEGSLVAYLAALLIGLYEYLMKSRWNSIRAFTCWILGKKSRILLDFPSPVYNKTVLKCLCASQVAEICFLSRDLVSSKGINLFTTKSSTIFHLHASLVFYYWHSIMFKPWTSNSYSLWKHTLSKFLVYANLKPFRELWGHIIVSELHNAVA